MRDTIVLIGPQGVGKSTVGELLASKLDMPYYSVDDLRWEYYKELGLHKENIQDHVKPEDSFRVRDRFLKPYEIHAAERVLATYSSCVIDFGAGNSVCEDDALFARIQRALQPISSVVLLLPSPDLDESVRFLYMRLLGMNGGAVKPWFDINEHYIRHHSNHDLAKVTIYTESKTPEEVCESIVGSLLWII